MATCPQCNIEIQENASFCESCGKPLVEGAIAAATPEKKPMTSHQKLHLKNIKYARITLFIVGLLILGVAAFNYYSYDTELKKIDKQKSEGSIFDEKALTDWNKQQMIGIGIIGFIGIFFIGLGFYAKKDPFLSCLIALIIYITGIVLGAIRDPQSAGDGIAIKAVIIIILASGVKSGLDFNRSKEKEEKQSRGES